MTSSLNLDFDLGSIIEGQRIDTLFQPLVSVKRGAVFGVEALSRAHRGGCRECIPPDLLFERAKKEDRLLELDRICRAKALENFLPLYEANRSLMVSINIDANIIGPRTTRSNHVLGLAESHGIHPNNIIIEIIESKAGDMASLMDFVSFYKESGFLIALDDVGAGHSNLDRIPLLKPHILKIDRSLVRDVHQLFHKQEIVKALQQMAAKVGTMVLAEGVETREEALALMEMGIEFFQGYHFARPGPARDGLLNLGPLLGGLAASFKTHMVEKINVQKRVEALNLRLARTVCTGLSKFHPGQWRPAVFDHLEAHPAIECIYILDESGVQITDTFCSPERLKESKRFIYEPAMVGTDHSLKEYVLPLKAGLSTYMTEPYISLASGNRCTTISVFFRDVEGRRRILCLDLVRER